MKRVWALLLVVSPATTRADPVAITVAPVPPAHDVRLHPHDAAGHDQGCTGPCVLRVPPGLYDVSVMGPSGQATVPGLDLSRPRTIEVTSSNRRLAVAGAATAVVGGLLALAAALVFTHGAIENLAASDCQGPCATVSGGTVRLSLAGVGVGVGMGALGVGMMVASARPRITPTD